MVKGINNCGKNNISKHFELPQNVTLSTSTYFTGNNNKKNHYFVALNFNVVGESQTLAPGLILYALYA